MTKKRFYLDRIENNIAVLIPEGEGPESHIPRAQLPSSAREGVWLIQKGAKEEYEVDEASTNSAKDDVQNLMDELAGG